MISIEELLAKAAQGLFLEIDLDVYNNGIRIKYDHDKTITFSLHQVIELAWLLQYLSQNPSRLVEIMETYKR